MATTRYGLTNWLLPVLLAVALASCGSAGDDDATPPTSEAANGSVDESSEEAGADDLTEASDEAEGDEATGDSDAVDETENAPEPSPREPAVFDPDATRLTQEFEVLDEDTYLVDTLGTPLSVVVDRVLEVQPNSGGFFVLTRAGSAGPDDDDIVFMRLSGLSDPTVPNTEIDSIEGGWAADDFNGWVANLADGVTASEPEQTMLGGFAATRIELEVGDIDCALGPVACVAFGTDHLVHTKFLNPDAGYRIWVVDQGDQPPIAVVVGTTDPEGEWFDTADEVLTNVAFGEPAPGPLSVIAGESEASFLGGVRLETGQESIAGQGASNRGILFAPGAPADIEFISRPADLEGNAFDTADEFLDVLRNGGIEAEELAGAVVGGIDARVFAISGAGAFDPLLLLGVDEQRFWFAPPLAQMWLIEHPDRGLLVINAESYVDEDEVLDGIVAEAEQIVSTLQFVDS